MERRSPAELADAVAASCASGFAYGIGNNTYIDGGYRRNENADLAAGCGRVLVLSPFGGRTRMPLEWDMQLAAQAEAATIFAPRPRSSSISSEVSSMLPSNA